MNPANEAQKPPRPQARLRRHVVLLLWARAWDGAPPLVPLQAGGCRLLAPRPSRPARSWPLRFLVVAGDPKIPISLVYSTNRAWWNKYGNGEPESRVAGWAGPSLLRAPSFPDRGAPRQVQSRWRPGRPPRQPLA